MIKTSFQTKYLTVTKTLSTILLVAVFSFFSQSLIGQKEIPKPPYPPQLVNDYAGLLSPGEINALERKLVKYNDSTSTQIAVVIENTLEGDDIVNYCQRLAETWGIGQADEDNGILIYVAFQDRKIRLHTGYGTEGFLPDIMASRIIDRVIVPAFRKGKYYDGLNETTDVIKDLAEGEYTADEMIGGNEPFPAEAVIFMVIFIVILIIIINNSDSGGGYHRGGKYERDRGGGWVIIGGPGGGGWNSGGGGLGGGGFGGFGGGGFGGGGASGGW